MGERAGERAGESENASLLITHSFSDSAGLSRDVCSDDVEGLAY